VADLKAATSAAAEADSAIQSAQKTEAEENVQTDPSCAWPPIEAKKTKWIGFEHSRGIKKSFSMLLTFKEQGVLSGNGHDEQGKFKLFGTYSKTHDVNILKLYTKPQEQNEAGYKYKGHIVPLPKGNVGLVGAHGRNHGSDETAMDKFEMLLSASTPLALGCDKDTALIQMQSAVGLDEDSRRAYWVLNSLKQKHQSFSEWKNTVTARPRPQIRLDHVHHGCMEPKPSLGAACPETEQYAVGPDHADRDLLLSSTASYLYLKHNLISLPVCI
jgi:hypothetical protein